MKRCTKCGILKPLSDFPLSHHHALGVGPYCKKCMNEYMKVWMKNKRKKNPTEVREYEKRKSKAWRKNNLQLVREQSKRQEAKLFQTCLDHYGHICSLCRSTKKLCMDHIGGNDGNSPRYGARLWRWIIIHKFPPNFRTLCRSCNTKDMQKRKKEREVKRGIDHSDN